MSRIFTAIIRDGVAVSDGFADLPDGTDVLVTLPDDDAPTAEELASMDAADAAIERGEYVTGEELLDRLRKRAAEPAER